MIVYGLIICGCFGCTNKQLLGSHRLSFDQYSQYSKPVSKQYKNEMFWIIQPKQICLLRAVNTATYLGSDSSYHYFRTWSKIGYEDEIYLFALERNSCFVEDEVTIDETVSNLASNNYRDMYFANGKCFVNQILNKKSNEKSPNNQ